jgi:hypothetical protein
MNFEVFGSNWQWPERGTVPSFAWVDCGNPQDVWRNVGIAPRILNLDIRSMLVVSSIPRAVYSQGKGPQYASAGGWLGPESIWTLWRREICLPLPGIKSRSPDRQVQTLVMLLTDLSLLLHNIKAITNHYLQFCETELTDLSGVCTSLKLPISEHFL